MFILERSNLVWDNSVADRPGLYEFEHDEERSYLWISMPYTLDNPRRPNKYVVHRLPLHRGERKVDKSQGYTIWWWDGNVDKPTLHPSIICGRRENPRWHGWLRDGVLESV